MLIVFGIIGLLVYGGFLITAKTTQDYDPIAFGLPALAIGVILLVIGITKWNSEEEHVEIKKAQLHALKKGKVKVNLDGKMRKLK